VEAIIDPGKSDRGLQGGLSLIQPQKLLQIIQDLISQSEVLSIALQAGYILIIGA